MALRLYGTNPSPLVKAVYLTAKALGITLEHVEVNLEEYDHLKPEFVKINPQHTIPTLKDEGKVIWDSHVINIYLVSKYRKDDSLYPADPYEQAVINQRPHFDSGVLYALLKRIVRLHDYKGVKIVPQDLIDEVDQGYDFLNKFLEGHKWVAGNDLTLADFSLLTSTTFLDVVVPIKGSIYPNVIAWIERSQKLSYYNVNQEGLNDFKVFMQKILAR